MTKSLRSRGVHRMSGKSCRTDIGTDNGPISDHSRFYHLPLYFSFFQYITLHEFTGFQRFPETENRRVYLEKDLEILVSGFLGLFEFIEV